MLYADGKTAILIFSGVYVSGTMHWNLVEMLAYGITLTQIADAFGLAQNTVARWRMPTDRLQPPADWKAKIAVAYDAAAERAEAEGARLRSVAAEYRRTTSATG